MVVACVSMRWEVKVGDYVIILNLGLIGFANNLNVKKAWKKESGMNFIFVPETLCEWLRYLLRKGTQE